MSEVEFRDEKDEVLVSWKWNLVVVSAAAIVLHSFPIPVVVIQHRIQNSSGQS